MQKSLKTKAQTSSGNATNKLLFTLLIATVVIPLPAMTPALLSRAVGAMTLISTPRAAAPQLVPIYFMPTNSRHRSLAMVPDTVLLGLADPETIINEVGADRGLAFEELHPIPIIDGFERPATRWFPPIRLPSVGGAGERGFPTAVPEPATWAMLVGGFMLAGTILRRRRRRDLAVLITRFG